MARWSRAGSALSWGGRNTCCVFCLMSACLLVTWSSLLSVGVPLHESSPRTDVLIVSYFQAGSSLVGRLLGVQPGALYWEEPLHPLQGAAWRALKGNQVLRHQSDRDRSIIRDSVEPREMDKITRLLEAIFTCDMWGVHNLHADILGWSLDNHSTTSWSLSDRLAHLLAQPLGLAPALLQTRCQQSSINVVKSTRMRMRHIEPIIRLQPNVKVIFVTRDPRGIISSWVQNRLFEEDHSEEVFSRFCQGLSMDSKDFNVLSLAYPSNVLSLKVEDLATGQPATLSALYRFLGLPAGGVEPGTEAGVLNHTELGAWRDMLRPDTIDTMTQVCKHALVKLRYEAFS